MISIIIPLTIFGSK